MQTKSSCVRTSRGCPRKQVYPVPQIHRLLSSSLHLCGNNRREDPVAKPNQSPRIRVQVKRNVITNKAPVREPPFASPIIPCIRGHALCLLLNFMLLAFARPNYGFALGTTNAIDLCIFTIFGEWRFGEFGIIIGLFAYTLFFNCGQININISLL